MCASMKQKTNNTEKTSEFAQNWLNANINSFTVDPSKSITLKAFYILLYYIYKSFHYNK